MAKKKRKALNCIYCGHVAGSLDEHIETHHNQYDVHRIVAAIVQEMSFVTGRLPSAVKRAQKTNRERLRARITCIDRIGKALAKRFDSKRRRRK